MSAKKTKITLYLGSDHNGFKTKEFFRKYLSRQGFKVRDLGNYKYQKLDDYPDFAQKVAKRISQNPKGRGLLFCGSGQGMAIAANRYAKVRAALGYNAAAARRSRLDNDANVLCLSTWEQNLAQMKKIINVWLPSKFSNLTRHRRRLKKIDHA